MFRLIRPRKEAGGRRLAALASAMIGCGGLFGALSHPPPVQAYSNGVPAFVTDVAPFCAGCHSSRSRQELREMALAHQEAQYYESKHYGAVERGQGSYGELSQEERRSILEDVKLVDANTAVSLSVSRHAKPGESIEVTVKTRGGGGPVIGVMLVDSDYRYQARPLPSSGWYVLSAPSVIGPDGQRQTAWTSQRASGLKNNLSFVTVDGIRCDLGAKTFSEATITWQLQAPRDPGSYPIVACLLYGTEKAAARGWRELPNGERIPVGGRDAASGRILFSTPAVVSVR